MKEHCTWRNDKGLRIGKPRNCLTSELMRIHEFQEMMRRLYYNRDRDRGVCGTYDWLVDEVEELAVALKAEDREAIEKEFADVIAWLSSLANIVDIDLEKAAVDKYHNVCPKCQQAPCHCEFQVARRLCPKPVKAQT